MFLIRFFSRLPLPVLYTIGDVLGFVSYYIIGYRKKVVYNNLRKAFPNKSEEEIKRISKEFYKRFGEYIAETIKAISISEVEMKRRVKFLNVSEVAGYAADGQSIILAGTHQFNWEWALLTGCLVLPFPVDAVYQSLSNKHFDKLMYDTRAKFGGKPIDKSNIIRSLVKSKDRLRAVAIMADQSPRRSSPKYWTTFMNQKTAFLTGPEQIARAMKYPVFFYRMTRIKRGNYTVELIKLTDPPYEKDSHEILDLYVTHCEQLIKDDPASYLWSHKRWKLKK